MRTTCTVCRSRADGRVNDLDKEVGRMKSEPSRMTGEKPGTRDDWKLSENTDKVGGKHLGRSWEMKYGQQKGLFWRKTW